MKDWIIRILFLTLSNLGFSQAFPDGLSFQAQVKKSDGQLLSNEPIGVIFNIRSNTMTGTIIWQEEQIITVNELGHFSTEIGITTSTGIGTVNTFSDIQWSQSLFFLEMLVDENNTQNYVSVSTQQLMSVPFAFHSKTTSQKYKLSELTDVDTTGIQIGDVLKWDGVKWVPETDNTISPADTVNFSFNSDSSNYATYSTYAINCIPPTYVDSSAYSAYSDSSTYAMTGLTSTYSDTAVYSDTSGVSLFSLGNWSLTGNNITDPSINFLGSTDSTDLVFKTHGNETMRIKANGKIGFGTPNPESEFHVNNTSGVLFTGNFGIGTIPTETFGTKMMWYPKKAAFRTGYGGSNWSDNLIGEYSIAAGYNTQASGTYSVAFGNQSQATDTGAFAVGNAAIASGVSSFAAGHNPNASGDYSIALGRGTLASNTGAIAIGYHPSATGQYSMALGNYVTASGDNSFAMGYRSNSIHSGSFVYSDQSSTIGLSSTGDNQFLIRASGGFIFYTSTDLSTGVTLAPGAGAWSILSDSTKKENIKNISPSNYIKALDSIEVYSWNYISQNDSINHIGPMAQDFYSAFGLGNDPTTINSGDFDGINLLLLKGLNEKLGIIENQNTKINNLENELENLKQKRKELEIKLMKLEKLITE